MNIGLIIFISVVILFTIGTIILVSINAKYTKIVKANSLRLQKVEKLNAKTHFNDIQKLSYSYHNRCTSKRAFDKLEADEYFIALIESNLDYFQVMQKPVYQNIIDYKKYTEDFEKIKTSANDELCNKLNIKLTRFIKKEEKLCRNIMMHPVIDISIKIKISYTSPAGRNSYAKDKVYNYKEFEEKLNYTKSLIKSRKSREYQIKVERSKLNDSLRYDVLKRDKFRCQICGSTAHDGVKLHVDHIIPVSKGGKTVLENLRTLCDRCNIGKSNKIE